MVCWQLTITGNTEGKKTNQFLAIDDLLIKYYLTDFAKLFALTNLYAVLSHSHYVSLILSAWIFFANHCGLSVLVCNGNLIN